MRQPTTEPPRRQRRVLQAVATFEFFKGIFVVLMGICALLLVHKDAWLIAESLLALFHINTDRHSAQLFLDFADNVTDARLWAAARIAFLYSGLRFAEAYGLWKCRTWAEWVALVSGTLLLPLEVRELFRGVTLLRCSLLVGNVAVVLYMLYIILTNGRERRKHVTPSA
jgi:Predicted membrane protein